MQNKHVYEGNFFNYVNTTSLRSAKYFLETVKFPIEIYSIVDIGCGKGAWLNQWREKYTKDILGVDGDYVDTDTLLIPKEDFQAVDLRQRIDLGRTFSLVQCLEVAEHIDASFADILVDNIVRHGDIVLFSAAQKGQGGEFHVNEQPINYWVEKFSGHDFICFDYIRPQVKNINMIEPWYRFNTVLFIRKEKLGTLALGEDFLATRADQNYDFAAAIDKSWLLRNKLLSFVPYSIINLLSKAKQRLLPIIRK